MNAAEVQMARLAFDKAQHPRVKEFAEMLIHDHRYAFNRVQNLIEARAEARIGGPGQATRQNQGNQNQQNVSPTVDPSTYKLNAEHTRTLNRLKGLSGDRFDREFIAVMVRNHRVAIDELEQASRAHDVTQQSRANVQHPNAADHKTAQTPSETARQKPDSNSKWTRSDFARDLDIAEYARDTLSTVRMHLEEAREIQERLGRLNTGTQQR